jgi:hypothetical protein
MYLQKVIRKSFKVTDEKSRIRIHKSVVGIRGSGSIPTCHGSITLVLAVFLIWIRVDSHCFRIGLASVADPGCLSQIPDPGS